MNTHVATAWSLALLVFLPPAHANAPTDYAYTFPIATRAGSTPESAWRFELTPEAYAWVQDASLGDVEVFNAAGQPVPLAPFAANPATTVREHDAALPVLALPAVAPANGAGNVHLVIDRAAGRIDLRESAAVAASTPRDVLLDASAFDRPLDRIVLTWDTPAVGIVARFEVSAGDDLQTWHRAGGGSVLALEQDGARLERRDIALGDARAKYLRLHRLDDGMELAGLSVRAFSRERDSAAPSQVWLDANPVPAPAEGEAQAPGAIGFHYLLPAALPVDSARIELANDNALARLELSARVSGSARWNAIANVTAFRLRSGDETIRNGEIALASGTRLREFRIASLTPLATAPRLAFGFQPQGFVFLAEGDAPYTLAVGSVRARHANYPLDAALASLRARLGRDWQPPLAPIGAARASAGAAAFEPLPVQVPTPWRRWLLWGVLVVGAGLVGGFSLSLLRGARSDNHHQR